MIPARAIARPSNGPAGSSGAGKTVPRGNARMVELPSSHTVPRRAETVLECELPGELLLHVPGGSEAIALNTSARAVWELCDGRRSIETIALELTDRFEAAPGEIVAAVRDVVRELVDLRVLQSPGPTGPYGADP